MSHHNNDHNLITFSTSKQDVRNTRKIKNIACSEQTVGTLKMIHLDDLI